MLEGKIFWGVMVGRFQVISHKIIDSIMNKADFLYITELCIGGSFSKQFFLRDTKAVRKI